MDIRIRKTQRSIYNAFIELRSKKPLERITIKELCEKAQINKSTFYVYYSDIYDLSEQIENEIITSVIKSIGSHEKMISNPAEFSEMLCTAYSAQLNLISTVFSGIRTEQLPRKIETAIKETLFEIHPEYRNNTEINLKLSYSIYGGYYAFSMYSGGSEINVIKEIGSMSEKIFGNNL
ncbi:MAG: TetR/AcrR family transcriptional regulator [Oscillospiraceae bacterium]|nr:TetR/AcrR family transcriptional regulator [Oscillospiraceae bacterium]